MFWGPCFGPCWGPAPYMGALGAVNATLFTITNAAYCGAMLNALAQPTVFSPIYQQPLVYPAPPVFVAEHQPQVVYQAPPVFVSERQPQVVYQTQPKLQTVDAEQARIVPATITPVNEQQNTGTFLRITTR